MNECFWGLCSKFLTLSVLNCSAVGVLTTFLKIPHDFRVLLGLNEWEAAFC